LNPAITVSAPSRTESSHLPVLLVLFSASGCSALIYEVVWYQLLQLAIGSTSVSLGVLLATFMGGLCIGSIWFPRIRWTQHPLRIYAAIECGLALFAVLVQFALPLLNRVYIAGAEHGLPGMLLRGLLAAVCMLPPTILMGASLPVVTRWIKTTPEGVAWWGYLYAGNTAGAVFGCLFAGFYLLRVYNMATATWVAAGINVCVAAISYLLAGLSVAPAFQENGEVASATFDEPQHSRWPVYLCIALSGATALGAEVVWTRLLSMLLLGTVYAFSIILAVFLFGLAIGSVAGSRLLRKIQARAALGWSQLLLALGIAWTAYAIIHVLPWIKDDVLVTNDAWHLYLLDLKRCILAILPTTLFWGASFPLACAAVAKPGEDSGKIAGGIYAANTLGGIVGALLVSLALIPWIGSQQSQRLLVIAAAVSGLLVLEPVLGRSVKGLAAVVGGRRR